MHARSSSAQDVPSTNPVTRSRSRRTGCPATGTRGCPFFWFLFFGQALRRRSGANGGAGPKGEGQDARSQEKGPARRRGERNSSESIALVANEALTAFANQQSTRSTQRAKRATHPKLTKPTATTGNTPPRRAARSASAGADGCRRGARNHSRPRGRAGSARRPGRRCAAPRHTRGCPRRCGSR